MLVDLQRAIGRLGGVLTAKEVGILQCGEQEHLLVSIRQQKLVAQRVETLWWKSSLRIECSKYIKNRLKRCWDGRPSKGDFASRLVSPRWEGRGEGTVLACLSKGREAQQPKHDPLVLHLKHHFLDFVCNCVDRIPIEQALLHLQLGGELGLSRGLNSTGDRKRGISSLAEFSSSPDLLRRLTVSFRCA